MVNVVCALFSAALLAFCLYLIVSTIRDHAGRIGYALMSPPAVIGQADLHRSLPDRLAPVRPGPEAAAPLPEIRVRSLIDA